MLITGSTAVLALIGWPVAQSVSPAMQNAALEALGLDLVYVAFPVAPQDLGDALRGLYSLGVRGANVTIPYKEKVLPLLARLSPEAQAVGAVNTLLREAGGWTGYNTDGAGFLLALETEAGFTVSGKRVLLLGAGGAAKAVAFTLAGAGAAEIAVANRTPARAAALAEALAARHLCRTRALPLAEEEIGAALAEADLLINALPLGMHPQPQEMPPVPPQALAPPLLVCDLIYNPRPTRLLRVARDRGCRTLDGLAMLVAQGALAFEIWTGVRPPLEVMRRAAEEALRLGGAAAAGPAENQREG